MAKQKWAKIPSNKILDRTIREIEKRGIKVILVENETEALEKVKNLLPNGAEVMTGSSTTLYQIGFMDYYLSDKHPWNALGLSIYNEKEKQNLLIILLQVLMQLQKQVIWLSSIDQELEVQPIVLQQVKLF